MKFLEFHTCFQTKIVVHIDALGSADPIPLGIGPPYVAVRIQPMAGELARYTVSSSHINDDAEEDIVHTSRVPAKIVQTSQFISRAARDIDVISCYSSSIRFIQVQNWEELDAVHTNSQHTLQGGYFWLGSNISQSFQC
jgi:hypothetical protein